MAKANQSILIRRCSIALEGVILLLLCTILFVFPCAANDALSHGSVSSDASTSSASSSHALPDLATPPAEITTSADSTTATADDTAERIDQLLLKAEHLRFGIAEGSLPIGARPRPSPHSFPAHPSLSHSAAADKAADLVGARTLYLEAAALGSSDALNSLGEMALEGGAASSSTASNLREAESFFNQSAALGNSEAQHHLAILNWLGLNSAGKIDEGTAMLYDYFSAMGGNPLAKMSLGYRHLHGLSAPKSCEAAVAYYQEVAEEVVAQSIKSPINVVIEKARLADERARSVAPEEDEDVIQYYKHSAENGDVAAQVALGHLHFYGARGFAQNPERAAQYFKAAASQGDTSAMSSLGQMHVQGLGVPQSNETAFKYLTQAAEKHNPGAQNGLGYLYLHGQGTQQSYPLALKWFKKSADQGNAEAQFNLGAMYFAGLGVDKKYSTALQYFTMAGHQGHTRALYNLGQMHLNGLGTIKSCAIGVKLHKTVAERGNWATVANEAHRNFLKGNYELAWMQYARAAEEGYEVAQANSAWMLDQGLGVGLADSAGTSNDDSSDSAAVTIDDAAPRVNRRYLLAHRHWTMAAQQGNIDSLRMLGDYAFEGFVTGTPDYPAAIKYYNQAAEHRNAQAMFNLGYMHERGLGIAAPDFHLAKRFYDNCLEVDSDAIVPVKIALLHLYARAYWQEYFGDDATNAATSASSSTTTAAATPSAARTLPGPLTWLWNHVHATGVSEWFQRVSSASSAFELFLSVEDVLLAILCLGLAIIVYIRSQR